MPTVGLKAIFRAVSNHPSIELLHLEGFHMYNDDINFAFYNMLAMNKSLKTLVLGDCFFPNTSLFEEGIKDNKTLNNLTLLANCFSVLNGSEGVRIAAEKRGRPLKIEEDGKVLHY